MNSPPVFRSQEQLEQMLLEALDEPSRPFTKKDMEYIRREGRRRIAEQKRLAAGKRKRK